jgi:hypothetical protein
MQKIWTECPKIVSLTLFRPAGSTTNIQDDAFVLTHSRMLHPTTREGDTSSVYVVEPLRLDYLRLRIVTLPQRLDNMFQRIDMLALGRLNLDAFAGASKLLKTLASKFADGRPRLHELRITALPDQILEVFTTSLLLFLSSFRGLRHLTVHCTSCSKVDVDSITNHGITLKRLCVVNGGMNRQAKDRCFDAADLHKIATACPNLEQLCTRSTTTGTRVTSWAHSQAPHSSQMSLSKHSALSQPCPTCAFFALRIHQTNATHTIGQENVCASLREIYRAVSSATVFKPAQTISSNISESMVLTCKCWCSHPVKY